MTRMKLIFIYGPPGVGKLTVATELAGLTGFKLFHNHVSISFLTRVFEFGTEPYERLIGKVRLDVIEEAARAGIDLVFTFVYAHPEDLPFVEQVCDAVERHGGEVGFVQLTCAAEALERRVQGLDRADQGKIASLEGFRQIMGRYHLFSPVPRRETLRIDNTDLAPRGRGTHSAALRPAPRLKGGTARRRLLYFAGCRECQGRSSNAMPMKAQVVSEATHLAYIIVEPERYAPEQRPYPLVVMLHGFGANMYDLASLSPPIDAEGYVYAFPNAPYAVDLGGGGAVGYSWSRGRPGMAETTLATESGPTPEERLEGCLAEIMEKTGATAGNMVLGGFSQGGGLTLRFGLRRPETFAGLIVLSGAFRDADGLKETLPPGRAQPIFIAHGLFDPMVTVERGKATKAFLEEAGYSPVYNEYEMAHEITPEVIHDLQQWLRGVLPPKGAGQEE